MTIGKNKNKSYKRMHTEHIEAMAYASCSKMIGNKTSRGGRRKKWYHDNNVMTNKINLSLSLEYFMEYWSDPYGMTVEGM